MFIYTKTQYKMFTKLVNYELLQICFHLLVAIMHNLECLVKMQYDQFVSSYCLLHKCTLFKFHLSVKIYSLYGVDIFFRNRHLKGSTTCLLINRLRSCSFIIASKVTLTCLTQADVRFPCLTRF